MKPSFAPLRGLRFNPKKVGDGVVAPPYDVIDPAGRERLAKKSPHNIVRLILPESYQGAAETLKRWIAEQVLIRDPRPSIYLYEQQFEVPQRGARLTRRGFIGLRRLEELGQEVLPHEQTLAGPKADRLELLKACDTNLSPLFALYDDPTRSVMATFASAFRQSAEVDFTDESGIRQRLWAVTDPRIISQVSEAMEGRRVFLADGHHRYSTALAYHHLHPRDPQKDYVLMFYAAMDDPGLLILPTHRVVSIPSSEAVLKNLPPSFAQQVSGGAEGLLNDLKKEERNGYAFGLLSPASPPTLVSWEPQSLPFPLSKIGTAVVHETLLKGVPLDRIRFVKEAGEVIEAVKRPGTGLGILLNPPRMAELKEAVEEGHLLPPKTTFFYPKLLSGLVLNPLSEI